MTPPFARAASLDGVDTIRHGFFGRQGGRSIGDLASLNMSVSGDEPTLVLSNRAQALESLGFSAETLALSKQTHSVAVRYVDAGNRSERAEADAMVTDRPGIVLGIMTADCTPILLVDPEAGVIGATHAGWKGAVGGIVGNTIAAMIERGARPERIRAAIGPTISAANYEVGPDFAADLLARHPDARRRIVRPQGGIEHFDLPGFVADQLLAAGVAHIEDLGLCTYAEPDRYFSHRFATHRGTTTGRQLSLIGLR